MSTLKNMRLKHGERVRLMKVRADSRNVAESDMTQLQLRARMKIRQYNNARSACYDSLRARGSELIQTIGDDAVRSKCASIVWWDICGGSEKLTPEGERITALRDNAWRYAENDDVAHALYSIGYPSWLAWERSRDPRNEWVQQ